MARLGLCGPRMRRLSLLPVFFIAAATCLCGGELLAQGKHPIVATSIAVRPDAMQFQAFVMEWIRATATSTQFMVGTVIGVAFAEGGRFALRGLMRGLAFLHGSFRFVMNYRLMVAAVVAAISYAVTHWVIL